MRPAMLLKEARLRAELTQEELGDRTGHSKSEISRWEREKVSLTFDRLAQLVAACGLELDVALRPADDSQHSLMRGNIGRSPEQRLNGLRRQLLRRAEIQGHKEIFDPRALLSALVDGGVDLIVIGGVAAVLRGSPYPTSSLDVIVRERVLNEARLQRVAIEMLSGDRRAADDLDLYATHFGVLQVVRRPISMPSYQALRRRSDPIDIAGRKVLVAPLADVIRSVEARPKRDRRAEVLNLRWLETETALLAG